MFGNTQIFRLAHAFARDAKAKGFSYAASFSIALKELYAKVKQMRSLPNPKLGQAKNGAWYVEVPVEKADFQSVQSLFHFVHNANSSPRRPRKSKDIIAKLGANIYNFVADGGKGHPFKNKDGVDVVRVYGTRTIVEKELLSV